MDGDWTDAGVWGGGKEIENLWGGDFVFRFVAMSRNFDRNGGGLLGGKFLSYLGELMEKRAVKSGFGVPTGHCCRTE